MNKSSRIDFLPELQKIGFDIFVGIFTSSLLGAYFFFEGNHILID